VFKTAENSTMSHYPRIACLCTESVETIYALGAEDEIKSADILSPGPSVITEGLRQISELIARWQTDA
jgi:ABC-type hemin transport system substrate-binding protein